VAGTPNGKDNPKKRFNTEVTEELAQKLALHGRTSKEKGARLRRRSYIPKRNPRPTLKKRGWGTQPKGNPRAHTQRRGVGHPLGLFGARGADGVLEFLEFLHFVSGLGGFALFAIQGGETEMSLSGQRGIFF
jgi:hypothetical protein